MKRQLKEILNAFSMLYSVSFSDSDDKARIKNLLTRKRKRPALFAVISVLCAAAMLISLVSCAAEPAAPAAIAEINHPQTDSIGNASLILDGSVKAHNDLFDLTVTSACVKNDRLELSYTIDLLQILNIDIENAIRQSYEPSAVSDDVHYRYNEYLRGLMSEKGYDRYFDLMTQIESGEYRLLSPRSSVEVNGTQFAAVERSINESEISLSYIGKEVWSLEQLDKAALDSLDVIVYSLGDDLSVTISLTSVEKLAASGSSSVCTDYGVTILATAETEGDSIIVNLYAVDAGPYDDILYNKGDFYEYSPYILTENGQRLYGTPLASSGGEDTMHIGTSYKFDLSGRNSGTVTVGFPAISAATHESVTIPITQENLSGKELDLKASFKHSNFSAERVRENFGSITHVEHTAELEISYTHTGSEEGVVTGQFQHYTVNGKEVQYGMCWGYANTSDHWIDPSPLTVALNCPYSEVREVVLKDPVYWLADGFEFTFDLEKLNSSETAASDKEDVDNINSQHRREALAECWHGDNKLKYICDLPEFEGVLESIHNDPHEEDFESYGVVCSDPTEQQARDYIKMVMEAGYNINAQLIDELDKGGILEYTASNKDGIICFISYSAYENERAYITIECSRIGDAHD